MMNNADIGNHVCVQESGGERLGHIQGTRSSALEHRVWGKEKIER